MSRRPRALVIGGGIAGPVTAIFLKQAGIDAELFEAWPYSAGIGGGLQIAPNGMHVLAEIGLAYEMIAARFGRGILRFLFAIRRPARLASTSNMKERFGQPAVNMCRATLNELLINKAWCENVELRFEKAAGRHRGPRRPAGRRAFCRRHLCRGRFRGRRRRRAFGCTRATSFRTAQSRSTPA